MSIPDLLAPGRAFSVAATDVRTCRGCGCTDDDCRQCIEKSGTPCHWVEADLCSACVPGAFVVPPFPRDASEANEALGATCGHFALAAILGCSVLKAAKFFYHLVAEGRSWTNLPMMHAALKGGTGREWRSTGSKWPQHGLVLIQFQGPWLKPGVPAAAACRHTHWVATAGQMVADVNADYWLPRRVWEECVPQLFTRRTTGWQVKRGIEVQPTPAAAETPAAQS